MFPSPRGDKLCPTARSQSKKSEMFPSPRGDKLCLVGKGIVDAALSFRPLAGISCVFCVFIG